VGIAVLALLVLLSAARLALQPIAERHVHRALESMNGMRGTFARLELNLLHLHAAVDDLRIDSVRSGKPAPFFRARRAEAGIYWKELLRRHVVLALKMERPKLYVLPSKGPGKPLDVAAELRKIGLPVRVDRAEIRSGEIVFVNVRDPDKPRIWLHDVDATLENFATRDALSRGEPSILAATGTLQRSGKFSVFASADPLAKALTFAGEGRIQGLQLVELGELLRAAADITPTKGTLSASARFVAKDGHLTGGLRPVVKNPSVQQAKPGLGPKIKSALADLSLDIFSDRVPGRNAVATTIPIEGDLSDPKAQLWPTVFGIFRNAFVTGLANSFSHLTPGSGKEGGEKSSTQARRPPASSGR
jgi:Domain of Unknown Function (DUF748)